LVGTGRGQDEARGVPGCLGHGRGGRERGTGGGRGGGRGGRKWGRKGYQRGMAFELPEGGTPAVSILKNKNQKDEISHRESERPIHRLRVSTLPPVSLLSSMNTFASVWRMPRPPSLPPSLPPALLSCPRPTSRKAGRRVGGRAGGRAGRG
jgi:hypothetical protein